MPEVTALQQVERTQLHGHQVQYSDAQHLVIIDGVGVPCTPTEYGLLVPLLYHAGEAVQYRHLLGMSGQQLLTRSIRLSLTRHISRLRARLWPFGMDIVCLIGYGYLLLSRRNGQAENT
jgi:DNA-binding response OmpR family regulator